MLEGSEWRKKMKSKMGEPATLKNGNPQNEKKKTKIPPERELGSQKKKVGGGGLNGGPNGGMLIKNGKK